MTVVAFDEGDLFVVRTIKSHTLNPDRKWANTYEFKAATSGGAAELQAAGEACVDFERLMTHDVIRYERLLISTWTPDSVPYNPESFMSIPQALLGDIGPVGDMLPLNQCLAIARRPLSGRFGHIFLRGALQEADVAAPSGTAVLSAPITMNTNIQTALTTSTLGDYITVGGHTTLVMVMVTADGSNNRPVATLTAQGVTTLPMDHAWFNRTAPS